MTAPRHSCTGARPQRHRRPHAHNRPRLNGHLALAEYSTYAESTDLKQQDNEATQRICVVSGGSHVRYLSYINHRIYALEHGLSHRLEVSLGENLTSPYWHKFVAIMNVLPEFDWVLWMDDDAYFTKWKEDSIGLAIGRAEQAGHFFIASEGPVEDNGAWSRINTGVMLIRNDPRSFALLETARTADLAEVRSWWSDSRDGLFTSGDQDTIWWTLSTRPEMENAFEILDHRYLNSRPQHYGSSLADATVVHFPGPGDKNLRIALFGRRFSMGQSLVPAHLLRKYSVRGDEIMPQREVLARRLSETARKTRRRIRIKLNWWRSGRGRR